MKNFYFEKPTQVFVVVNAENYYNGIAYKDEVICLYNGETKKYLK